MFMSVLHNLMHSVIHDMQGAYYLSQYYVMVGRKTQCERRRVKSYGMVAVYVYID